MYAGIVGGKNFEERSNFDGGFNKLGVARIRVDVAIIEVGLGGRLDPTNVVKLVWYYNNALGRPKKKKFIARAKSISGYYEAFWMELDGVKQIWKNRKQIWKNRKELK
ncbi:uncharacterized protein A4U43_C05F14820 [Asparagus officinalis]|uniref:Uncharacterized protein n=1 Tax=Asparagus officinalis TaxID=4686 RepID=A0A5P1ERM8_ASPOF|nr:uncharacterized protein A4U43_C05F14820 [Asparagus officinalis]